MLKEHISILRNNTLILKGFFLVFGLRMVQMGLGFAATFFLARCLSVDQYGQYNFVIGAIGVLSVFSLTEMNNAVMQSVARGYYGTYKSAILKTFQFSTIASVILWGMSAYYCLIKGDLYLALGLLIAGACFPFYRGLIQWKSLRVAEHKFKELARIEGMNSITTNVAIVVAVLWVPEHLLPPLLCFLIIPACRNVLTTLIDIRNIPQESKSESGSMEYGLKSSLIGSLSQLSVDLDRIILFFFLSPAAVAMFSAADRISDIFKSLTQDLAGVMAPKLARQQEYSSNLDKLFMLYSLVLGVGLILFCFTLLPQVFVIIFTEKYTEAIPYAQALLCSNVIGNFAILRFRYVRSQMDIKNYKNVTIGAAIVRILSLLILVPFFGVWGAIAATFIYRITTSVLINNLIKRDYLAV